MKLGISYFDNVISFENGSVSVLEIENKEYFYYVVSDFIQLENGSFVENIRFGENDGTECSHIIFKVIINYFVFSFDSTKMNNYVMKQILGTIESKEKESISKEFQKICKCFSQILGKIDLPLSFEEELNMESFIKLLKVRISSKNKLIDNLLLLIEISKLLENNDLLVFVNLKQYLTKEELVELYKYSIYNEVKIFLIDSQAYGIKLDYEKKLLIDENLDEFMI